MDKRQIEAEMQQTMDLLSGKIEQATPCVEALAGKVRNGARKAADKIDHAVERVADQVQKKQGKG